MERRSVEGFIYFGTALRYLQDCAEGFACEGDGGVGENTEKLVQRAESERMFVTARLARMNLLPILSTMREARDGGVDDPLTAMEARQIRKAAGDLRDTLMAEAVGVEAFFITDKRFEVERLLDDVPALFAEGVFADLPEVAQGDFQDACRCLAFELATAAAFHLLRGTEDVLRSFYRELVRQSRVAAMWGPMTDHLRQRRQRPPDVLLNSLDHIRVGYRNPTQHPERTYDIDEAQDLLGLCIEVVNRMWRHAREAGRPLGIDT